MGVLVYIYTKRAFSVPKLISETLSCRRGLKLPRNKNTLILNWGRQADFSEYPYVINRTIKNKLTAFKLFKENKVKCPDFWFTIPIDNLPVLGRDKTHFQGKDIVLIKNSKDYVYKDFYVKYIDKKQEFRVHLFEDTIINISKKLPRENEEQDKIVWCSNRGWRQIRYNEEGIHRKKLESLAKKALKALSYRFGAVDIILDKDNELWVLEVNSAPNMEGNKVTKFIEILRSLERV